MRYSFEGNNVLKDGEIFIEGCPDAESVAAELNASVRIISSELVRLPGIPNPKKFNDPETGRSRATLPVPAQPGNGDSCS